MKKLIQYWWIGVPALFIAGSALADYAATAGSGLTFASVGSSPQYLANLLCDFVAGKTQCAAVSAAGAVKVDNSGVTQPVSGTVAVSSLSGTVNTGLATGTYGTAPGAVAATPVNSFITNLNGNGVAAPSASAPVIAAQVSTASAIAAATPGSFNVIKASAGFVSSIQLSNVGVVAYLKLYNAASGTCGTGTPVKRLLIPVASTAANGAGSNIVFPQPIAFSTGITWCVTGALPDADTTAITANTVLVNIDWN